MHTVEPQRSPRTVTSVLAAGLQISTCSRPATGLRYGGDWCEAFPLAGERVALSIGDVCGHDRQAVREMLSVRARIRSKLPAMTSPAQTLATVNDDLCRAERRHATGVLGIIDVPNRELRFASAGHPRPLLVERSGIRPLGLPQGNLPLGVQPGVEFDEHRVRLPADGLLILYTDGATEHRGGQRLGNVRLTNHAARAAYRRSVDAARAFAEYLELEADARDDVAVLAISLSPATF